MAFFFLLFVFFGGFVCCEVFAMREEPFREKSYESESENGGGEKLLELERLVEQAKQQCGCKSIHFKVQNFGGGDGLRVLMCQGREDRVGSMIIVQKGLFLTVDSRDNTSSFVSETHLEPNLTDFKDSLIDDEGHSSSTNNNSSVEVLSTSENSDNNNTEKKEVVKRKQKNEENRCVIVKYPRYPDLNDIVEREIPVLEAVDREREQWAKTLSKNSRKKDRFDRVVKMLANDPGGSFLMESMEGASLCKFLKAINGSVWEARLGAEFAFMIAREMLLALEQLHRVAVHGDVHEWNFVLSANFLWKPAEKKHSNDSANHWTREQLQTLLFSDSAPFRLKLIDFGRSQLLSGGGSETFEERQRKGLAWDLAGVGRVLERFFASRLRAMLAKKAERGRKRRRHHLQAEKLVALSSVFYESYLVQKEPVLSRSFPTARGALDFLDGRCELALEEHPANLGDDKADGEEKGEKRHRRRSKKNKRKWKKPKRGPKIWENSVEKKPIICEML